ncbi:MAG TPA: hypothetical protein VL093_05660 [Flavipsychrobacter sp.]|nr:hypothetical protein [Flavipsychrobacter sp.]
MKTVLNWSSGKDAAMAYFLLQQNTQYEVVQLLTTINKENDRIVMHGVRESLLEMQATRMNLPLEKIYLPSSPANEIYQMKMESALTKLKTQDIKAAVFGDLFLEDLKAYRESQLAKIGMEAIFPLWKMNTTELVRKLEATGIEAIIVCVNEKCLGKEFLGRKVDLDLLDDLPANVDPCGENGEYHSFVYNAPFFSDPIRIHKGEIVYKKYPAAKESDGTSGFYFLDLIAGNTSS